MPSILASCADPIYLDIKINRNIFMSRQNAMALDGIDERRAQWTRELPDLDTAGMAVIGRMRWITLQLRPPIEAIFARHGLDSGEFDVISTLRRAGPPYRLRPTELFRSLMISSGGLTARLDRLAKAGLVTRESAPDDARSLLVTLTPQGRALAEAAFREDMAFESNVLCALDAEELQSFEVLLRKLVASLQPEEQVA
jgi:DNA-binding MarR family transcriptional regulator